MVYVILMVCWIQEFYNISFLLYRFYNVCVKYPTISLHYIYQKRIIKTFMLGITMKLDILVRLTPQVTTIICHHMKKK